MIRTLVLALALGLAPVVSAEAQDGADLVVRLNRIEGQMRQLSGQVEQLGFENRQLRDQLRRFQEDTEFRLQERPGGRGATPAAPPAMEAPRRRGDAFEPGSAPGAPGAPRPLGSPGGPTPGAQGGIAGIIDEDAGGAPLDLGSTGRNAPAASSPPRGPSAAAAGSDDPRADYDAAYAYLIQKQYEQAEMGFRRFLQSHPRDRLVPDAVYWLGDSYLQRSRPREAAEQFLKVSTEYGRSAKAPDALLKLGVSLSALGARDQACATFAELERKFPAASASLKQGVEREQKRARCPA